MQSTIRALVCPITGCKANQVCIDPDCSSHPCVCNDEACACQEAHEVHSKINLSGFEKRLRERPAVPADLQYAEKLLITTVDAAIARLAGLKEAFKLHVDKAVAGHYKHGHLRQKLIDGEQPAASEMTGQNMHRLLQEIKSGAKDVEQFAALLPKELEAAANTAISQVEGIADDISRAWRMVSGEVQNSSASNSSIAFRTQAVTAAYIQKQPASTTTLDMRLAFSQEWQAVGKAMLDLKVLDTVELRDCDSGDALCVALSESKALRRLRMGRLELTQRPAA